MLSWSEMKDQVEAQMSRDPQRATLSARAIAGVEEGLRHLTGVGYNFEIAPRGTLEELTEMKGEPEVETNSLSIPDTQRLLATPKSAQVSQFDAMVERAK